MRRNRKLDRRHLSLVLDVDPLSQPLEWAYVFTATISVIVFITWCALASIGLVEPPFGIGG